MPKAEAIFISRRNGDTVYVVVRAGRKWLAGCKVYARRKDLLAAWKGYSDESEARRAILAGKAIPWKALRVDPRVDVREAVAQYGSATDRKALRVDPSWRVRWAVAQYGSASDRKALRDDPDAGVRWAVAQYGSEADRRALRDDPDRGVRCAVRAGGEG